MYYELTPAHGRDYSSVAEVRAAFLAGKDFVGDYQLRFSLVNIDDFKPGDKVNLRFHKNRRVYPFAVPERTATASQ